ncbi:vacuolar transporter chaperone 4 [Nannochloropsis oceanica]
MKFGLYLRENVVEEWKQYYLQYDKLKRMIRILAEVESKAMAPEPTLTGKVGFSLTVPPPTNAAAQPLGRAGKGMGGVMDGDSDDEDSSGGDEADAAPVTHELFFDLLEKEIQKVHNFTDRKVTEIRAKLRDVGKRLKIGTIEVVPGGQPLEIGDAVRKEVDEVGEQFLRLEKYVNLNYTGFHKILKKHDRWLTNPCRTFYLQRLQNHNWTQGDYSDVVVTMSQIWSALRGDVAPEGTATESQEFVRSTTKYWIQDEDISQLKWFVLQHLPVLLQESMGTKSDSQLVNSVYLDNATLELYKGRLDKTPGAIAVRFRWYGSGTPELVFVERKTHREAWTAEMSVKERFTVHPSEVPEILAGRFDKAKHVEKMRAKGKSEKEVEDWDILVTEVCQAINSKQLVPTLRTQYMRTAFQIPFDATVRISLDTNLCMLTETGRLGMDQDRWFRDPSKPVPRNEITRFPHAVLEVKLQLKDEGAKPQWVTDLLSSGIPREVHKFSKFIHGCAVLLPEEVQAMPYWIDDPSLRESIAASGSENILEPESGKKGGVGGMLAHMLPHGKEGKEKAKTTALSAAAKRTPAPTPRRDSETPLPSRVSVGASKGKAWSAPLMASTEEEYYEDEEGGPGCWESMCGGCFAWAAPPEISARMAQQKVEPKLFFANERTFIHWLNMAVTISSLGAAVLAFSPEDTVSELYGIILMPVSLLFALYALNTYITRSAKIRTREPTRWDDPMGPVLLGSIFTLALTAQFLIKLAHVLKQDEV